MRNSRQINENKLAKKSIRWEQISREIKREKSQSKTLEVFTVLSRRPKEPPLHQIQTAGKGQVAIIRLIILETALGLAEEGRARPFPKAGSCGFYHHAKAQELPSKGSRPPVWVHSL